MLRNKILFKKDVRSLTMSLTVSNNAKFQVPFRDHQNPGDQIFNSRDDSFSADIIRETDGKGLDLVLNSLSGEFSASIMEMYHRVRKACGTWEERHRRIR